MRLTEDKKGARWLYDIISCIKIHMKKIGKVGLLLLLGLSVFFFCYFRLKPIYFQTVPYTYDQGRDFLKAQEIVQEHRLTFIGPTTGVQGVFHGAWWYYLLVIPYLLFKGNPGGFSLFLVLVFLSSTVAFSFFLKKRFNKETALFFFTLVSLSPYFIYNSFFAISSFPLLPLTLLFLYLVYRFLSDKSPRTLFFLFLTLGLIFETEMAQGFFLIPSFLIAVVATKNLKKIVGKWKNTGYSALGFFVAVLPRVLFELKNHFLQTTNFINFAKSSEKTHPTTFYGAFIERIKLFWEFYLSLYPENNIYLAVTGLAIGSIALVLALRTLEKHKKQYLSFLLILLGSLFILTLFYRNNFFWDYYLEGISFYLALFLSIGFFAFTKYKNKYLRHVPLAFTILLLIFGIVQFKKDVSAKNVSTPSGLKEQVKVVEALYHDVGKKDFCVRIYTPPVIPYTYNYLFSFYGRTKGYKVPKDTYVNGQCWYIIEQDQYQFRIDAWRKDHIPSHNKKVKKNTINNVVIELWENQ